ncbi:MAG TPA: hypothetical protein VFD92_28175 [Candidatus Binatia bacterium]|nr:hypothetical protein [Candidatus Binatia bacterium]
MVDDGVDEVEGNRQSALAVSDAIRDRPDDGGLEDQRGDDDEQDDGGGRVHRL